MDKISRANSLLREAAELLNPTSSESSAGDSQGTPSTTSLTSQHGTSTTASTTTGINASTSSSSVISRSVVFITIS